MKSMLVKTELKKSAITSGSEGSTRESGDSMKSMLVKTELKKSAITSGSEGSTFPLVRVCGVLSVGGV